MLYGVQQCELSWFKSYLTNRKQFCMINGPEFDIGDIDRGIPQGFCLGPLLFILCINDLPQAIKQSTISLYADDTSLCYQSSNMTQLIEAINMDLKELDTWLQGNKLSLNVAKTHSMLLSTKQRKHTLKSRNETFHLKIRGNELQDATKAKYLGVVIDCSLDWREQIQSISCKVSRAIGFLPANGNRYSPLQRHCRTSFSILLFGLWLCWQNGSKPVAIASKSSCQNCNR